MHLKKFKGDYKTHKNTYNGTLTKRKKRKKNTHAMESFTSVYSSSYLPLHSTSKKFKLKQVLQAFNDKPIKAHLLLDS